MELETIDLQIKIGWSGIQTRHRLILSLSWKGEMDRFVQDGRDQWT